MYPLKGEVTPSPTSRPFYVSPSPLPLPDPAAAAEKKKEVNAAAAVFGSLGGLLLAAGAIVLFLPTASFMLGSTRVVPADVIKSAAASTWEGAKAVGRGVGSLFGGGASSAGATAPSFTSGSTTFAASSYKAVEPPAGSSGASEKRGLLEKK